MLVIRLARHGRNKYPVYRIVAADKRRAATSKYVAILGNYNPHTKEIVLNKEKIEMYLSNGAQASDRVLRLLKAEGIKLPSWANIHDRNKAPKNQEEASSDAAPEGVETAEATADVTEAKAEDQKTDVGTAKEADEVKNEAEAQEKAAEAAEEASKEEKQPE
ncbi:MAG: 30S ribosomal protein S16 [Candidatus Saccharibacteria bacterium]